VPPVDRAFKLTIGLRSYKVAVVKRHQLEALNGMRTLREKYGLFTERGLALYALGVVVAYVTILLSRFLGRSPHFQGQNCTDFTWIWLSSHFAASSHPVHVYDHSAFLAAKAALVGPPDCVLGYFDSPPSIFFLVYPLHLFPYPIAFALWIAATLAVYLLAVYIIIPHRSALTVALTVYPAWINTVMGQDGFLTAGFIGLALAFTETRPKLAGLFLALLTYKPQFGILFPAALALSRNWRALAAGAVACIAFVAIAGFAFGYATWPAFMQSLGDRASALSNDRTAAAPLVSVLFLLSQGANAHVVWAVQLAIAAIATGIVCLIWVRPYPYALKAATLAIGSVIVSPHVISYDLCILTIGGAFFVKDGLSRGFLRGERGILLVCWASLFIFVGPIPTLVAITLFILTVRRAIRLVVQKPAPMQFRAAKEPI
jgi:hypothetical protein